ncbi:MAG: signal transduction histidine kinase [Candidatus Krumholzibacteriia bacterium]|jgi:signal transduction histidine kinase
MTGGRRWFIWAALAYVAIVVAVFFGLSQLYDKAYNRLDEALGQRLLAVASTLAEMTDGQEVLSHTLGDTTSDYYLETLLEKITTIASQENLSEVTLTNPLDKVVIFSTSASLVSDEPNDFWGLDPEAMESAAIGVGTATRLYVVDAELGLKQKSAHAPIMNYVADGGYVVAVITVSGSPDYFTTLTDLRRGTYLTGSVVLVVLVAMGIFLWQISLSLSRYRTAMMRQESLAAMGRMTAGIAHEIRNPLGIIRGAGQHLQRVLNDHDIVDEVADYIPEEVDRLDNILAGYLAFGSENEALLEEFELNEVLSRILQLMRDDLNANGVTLARENEAESLNVVGDPRRLQQVVINLLINARDAMPDGGVITVDADCNDSAVTVSISDEGKGLSRDHADKLFEPFWTDKEKGSGLGLAMSRRIMEDMDGGLNLESRSDRSGAVATFWLPSKERA